MLHTDMPDTITDTTPVLVLSHGGGWHVGGKVIRLGPANGFRSLTMLERPSSEVNALVGAFIAAHPRR